MRSHKTKYNSTFTFYQKIKLFKMSKSDLKKFDFTPIGSTALFPKIKFILGNIFYLKK